MAQTPATNRQNPDAAILDHFGKQTYLGNSYILPAPAAGVTITSGQGEVAIALISNPAVSTSAFPAVNKGIFLFQRKVASTDTILVRFYSNPTIAGHSVQTVAPVADTGAFASTIVHVPSTAGAAQGDYVVLSTTAGAKVALWLDIDANGSAPTGAAYVAAATKVKVSIVTGGTAAANGAIFKTAINGVGGYSAVDNLDGTVTTTQTLLGSVTAPGKHNTGDSGNGSFTFSGTVTGAASNLQSSYFLLSDANDANKYYVWMNASSLGVDPAVTGRTGVPIAYTAGATAATIGGLIATAVAALNSTNSFTTSGTTTVTITDKGTGPVTPMVDGTAATGFTFTETSGYGTPTTPVNLRLASGNTSVSQCFLNPLPTANGTYLDVLGSAVNVPASSSAPFIIDPGQVLLITAQTAVASAILYQEYCWNEI